MTDFRNKPNNVTKKQGVLISQSMIIERLCISAINQQDHLCLVKKYIGFDAKKS